jgi:hypothetical protein
MTRFRRWQTLTFSLLVAVTLGVVSASPAFATETDWQNIEGWSQSISSSDSAAAISYGSDQMSVWRGEGSGATRIFWSLNGSLPQQIAGGASENAPSLVRWNGLPTALIRFPGNEIAYSFFQANTWSAWHIVPNFDTTLGTPSATTINNSRTMEVVYRGTNNRMYMFAMEQHNNNPADPDQVGQGEVGGAGLTDHSPAIARVRSVAGFDGVLIVHTGRDGHVYYQHALVEVLLGGEDYLTPIYEDRWTEIRDQDGQRWVTNSRPTVASNIQNLGLVRVGMLDLDNNMAYIGGTNAGYGLTQFGNWQVEHSRAPLVAPPTLYNNTSTGEIDAIAFVNTGLFHLMRVMRCD